jgi:hypothetical protein
MHHTIFIDTMNQVNELKREKLKTLQKSIMDCTFNQGEVNKNRSITMILRFNTLKNNNIDQFTAILLSEVSQ